MSWNNYNISIPYEMIPLGELVVLTTGTTYNNKTTGTAVSPGRIYQDYKCTELLTLRDNPHLMVNPPDGVYSKYNVDLTSQDPIRIIGPLAGKTMKWSFTGFDVQSWGDLGSDSWIAKCFCENPCTYPSNKDMSGQTLNYTTGQFRETRLGGSAFDNVNLF